MNNPIVKESFREDMLPHIWCSGCGNGILMHCIVRAIAKNKLDKNKVCVVSGIGCSSRATGYLDFNTIHTTHGRAIAVATGIKMAQEDLEVIVITGDGDATAIGGNHFIHACRRNMDITVVVFNNNIYGMTGGQYSPTTPENDYATTAPYGNIDQSFDIPELAKAAGATFVARGTTYYTDKTTELISRGLKHRGLAVIECISTCPVYYGRKNKKGSAVSMLEWQKENSIDKKAADRMTPEQLEGKLIVGELFQTNIPSYNEQYNKVIARSKEGL